MSAPRVRDELFVGRYRVVRELGRGGMGTVDLAFQTDLERHVALKRILPRNIGLASAEGWFRRESRALAAIRHPGVPAVHDCGKSSDKISYFTMEVIDGPSLRAALDTRRFAALEAITIAIDLARILAAAHAVGVVHRDVKPANIVLEAGGRVRVIDFGICVFLPSFKGPRSNLRSVDPEEYQTGPMEVAGTIGYTDPALLDGHPVQPQSDIFSVAVVLYEMLTGRRLYDDRAGKFQAIDSGEFAPELAPVVAEIRRGSERLPQDRHASMHELIRGLEIARSVVRRNDDRLRRRGWWLGLSLLNGSLTLVTLVVLWRSGSVVVDPPVGVEAVAEVVSAQVVPAQVVPAAVQPAADRSADVVPVPLPARKSRARGVDAQEQVTRAARPVAGALRECLAGSAASELGIHLEVEVAARRATLTRVEWLPYDPQDGAQRCVARVLGAVRFPDVAAGVYRLTAGG